MSSQNVQEEGMEKEVPEVPEEENTPEEVEAPKKGKVIFFLNYNIFREKGKRE